MHLFDRDISLSRHTSATFKGLVSGDWSINGSANGGYLVAMLANALVQQGENKPLSIFTTNFISRCLPGQADITLESIGTSRNFARWQIGLAQNGQEKVRAFGTFANNGKERQEKIYETSAPLMPPPEECVAVPEIPNYTLYSQMDVRLASDCAGWMQGNLSDRSEIRGWIRFRDERPLDTLAILLMADAFPPAVLASQGMVAWVPTIELSVNIRNIPKAQWLQCVFRSRFIGNGIAEEDGEIWDEAGELIAISRQIVQFRR
jgi:acyl-CoA thioesterase